jgi:hypothetical protein
MKLHRFPCTSHAVIMGPLRQSHNRRFTFSNLPHNKIPMASLAAKRADDTPSEATGIC